MRFMQLTEEGFNPRPSCEGRREFDVQFKTVTRFNPRPSCEGRLEQLQHILYIKIVSIHAPLARGDTL